MSRCTGRIFLLNCLPVRFGKGSTFFCFFKVFFPVYSRLVSTDGRPCRYFKLHGILIFIYIFFIRHICFSFHCTLYYTMLIHDNQPLFTNKTAFVRKEFCTNAVFYCIIPCSLLSRQEEQVPFRPFLHPGTDRFRLRGDRRRRT